MTKFQSTLPKDLDTCWQIVKVFHPNLKEEDRVRMKVSKGSSYQWVQIEFRVKGYGLISIGVSNVNNYSVFGRVSLGTMKKAIKNGNVSFRCWRFSLDRDYIKFDKDYADYEAKTDIEENRVNPLCETILKNAGYELMSARAWYHNYYKD